MLSAQYRPNLWYTVHTTQEIFDCDCGLLEQFDAVQFG